MGFLTAELEMLAAVMGNSQGIGSAMSIQAAAIHQIFVAVLGVRQTSYAATEAANAITAG